MKQIPPKFSLHRLLFALPCLVLPASAALTDSRVLSTSEFAFEITDTETPALVTAPESFTVTVDAVTASWQVTGGEGIINGSITTPAVTVSEAGAVEMTLTHRFNFEGDGTPEGAYDGGVVQYNVNGGAFQTLTIENFSQNGYYDSPIIGNGDLIGAPGFNGITPGFANGDTVESIATIPGISSGDSIRLRFLGAWDDGFTPDGLDWVINGVALKVGETELLNEDFSTGDGGFSADSTGPGANWSFVEASAPVVGELVATKVDGVLTLSLPIEWQGGLEYHFTINGMDSLGGDVSYETVVFGPTPVLAPPLTWPDTIPGPLGREGSWGVRTYLNEGIESAETLEATLNFLARSEDRTPELSPANVVDSQETTLNFVDPESNAIGSLWGVIPCSRAFPANDLSTANNGGTAKGDDYIVTTAQGTISITEESDYTFNIRGDDGFMFRILSPGGSHPEFVANEGLGLVDRDSQNTLYFPNGTGDSNTRGVVHLKPGIYNLEFVHWEGAGGFFYQVSAAKGFFLKDTDTNTWSAIGNTTTRTTPIPYPSIVGDWTVQATLPGASVGSISTANNSIDEAVAADAVASTSTWPAINFNDPGFGGPGRIADDVPWPRDVDAVDDDNYALRMSATLRIPEDGNYLFGFQGDDGAELSIGGVDESFSAIIENATGSTTIGKGNTVAVNSGSLGAQANFSRETSALFGQPGALAGSSNTAVATTAADGQRLGAPFLPELNPAGAFTAELWVKPGVIPDGLTAVVSSGNFGDPRSGWLIYMDPAAGWNFRGYANSGLDAAFNITGGGIPVEGNWYHLVATWNGSDAKIYVNGVLDAGAQVTGITNYVNATAPVTSGRLHVGSRADNTFNWTGTADELAIYPAELSAVTIQEHYTNGLNPTRTKPYPDLVAESSPLGYWRFDEAQQPLADLNTLTADVPTGNSSSVGRIFLAAGDYPINATYWEAAGGSYFEIFGSYEAPDACVPLKSLRTDGWESVPSSPGLVLVPSPNLTQLKINGGVTILEGGNLSLNFNSVPGLTYTLSVSDDLETWTALDDSILATESVTTIENLIGFRYTAATPKRFFRIEQND
ncbi:LamG-like jellyroll fold domain-containing protein [Verrucomicrobiaceae bacterium 227]